MLIYWIGSRSPKQTVNCIVSEKSLNCDIELHYNTFGEDSCIIDGWECGFPNNISKWKIPLKNFQNEKDLSQLLHGFFEFYNEFDYKNYIISPYEGRPVKKEPNGGMIILKHGNEKCTCR